jgi:hypothetical protein
MYISTPMVSTPPRGHTLVPDSKLRITPIPNSTFGAIGTGIDLRSATPKELSAIERAWEEYGVLIFRNQKSMSPKDELAFALNFPHNRTCNLEPLIPEMI